MSCSVPANQPIYQALLDKAASYPADKPYQAKAYKKAAEIVAAHPGNIYSEYAGSFWFEAKPAAIGYKIEEFINKFIKANPKPVETPKAEPEITFPTLTGAAKAMDDARKAAAAAAPKDVTVWPNDDAERTAFLARVAASKEVDVQELKTRLLAVNGQLTKPVETPQPKQKTALDFYYESQKPVIYTPENPRRSKRLVNKPKVQYFTKEDEDDEIAEAIEAVCAKKGWVYSDDLMTEFETWLPTADKYTLEKYDYNTDKYIPRSKPEIAKVWARYDSTSLQKQQKQLKLNKGLIKYCEKNNIEYQDLMADKFAAWMADPANKPLITITYKNFGGDSCCNCTSCNPTGAPSVTSEYIYDRSPAYCINKWFSTLKKQIVW